MPSLNSRTIAGFLAQLKEKANRRSVNQLWIANNTSRRKKQMAAWYARTKRKRYIQHRKWRIENRLKRNADKRKWYQVHRDAVLRSNARCAAKNKAKYDKTRRRWRLKNKLRIRLRKQLYHKRTYPQRKHRLIKQTTEYIRLHPEVRRRSYLNYKKRHPEKYKLTNAITNRRRQALRRGCPKAVKSADELIKAWRLEKEFECSYCHVTFPSNKMTVDHIIPVTKGGVHSSENICRSCLPCNVRKGNHLIA